MKAIAAAILFLAWTIAIMHDDHPFESYSDPVKAIAAGGWLVLFIVAVVFLVR